MGALSRQRPVGRAGAKHKSPRSPSHDHVRPSLDQAAYADWTGEPRRPTLDSPADDAHGRRVHGHGLNNGRAVLGQPRLELERRSAGSPVELEVGKGRLGLGKFPLP